MKHKIVIAALLASLSLAASAAPVDGWFLAGAQPKAYEIGEDHTETVSGKTSRYIRSKTETAGEFGTLMQSISAKNYQGKRVRFQAMVKSRNVANWAGLWMRADTPTNAGAAFYNSIDNPIKGSTDWHLRSVTLDIPADATALSFGVIDAGGGQVWIDELALDEVGQEVPVNRQLGFATTPVL